MARRTLILQILVFVLLFGIFAFTRFYNIHNRIIFNWDQEQFANQIKDIISNHKLTLIGPRVVGPQGFFLAPYFTYIILPFFLMTKMNPWALLYFIVLYNIFFFLASFFIIRRIFNVWYALSFLTFWTFGYLFINYDTIPWNPILIPIGILTTFYLLYRLYHDRHPLNWILLGVAMGLFVNIHFQYIFLIIFVVAFLVFQHLERTKITLRQIAYVVVSFIAMFSPIFLFDLRHNFLNSKLLLTFFTSKSTDAANLSDPVVWVTVLGNALQPFTYIAEAPAVIAVYFVMLYFLRQLWLQKKGFYKVFYQASTVMWILFPIFFMIYQKRPSEYYFIFVYLFMILGFIDFFVTIKKPFVIPIVMVIFLLINIPLIPPRLNTNYNSLYYKDLLVRKIVQKVPPGYKFNISFDVTPGGDTGFRYLFDWYHIKQSGNMTDTLIQIRTQPHDDGDINIGGFTLLLPKNLRD